MKTVLLFASFISLAAQATPLLIRTSTNGALAPEFARITTCTLDAAVVRIGTRGPLIDFPYTLQKKMVFNTEIPNLTVLQSLIEEAAHTLPTRPALNPVVCGGGVTHVEANLQDGKEITLISMMGSIVEEKNHSLAAEKLLKFLDLNCLAKFAINPDFR